ncbi:MAG TPA: RluA family pseudouridine synthase [Pyrinomonadaceae bacterium]
MSERFQFGVGEDEAGARLDHFLAARLPGLSRMRIASLVAAGACTVNGAAAHPGRKLRDGDSVGITFDEDAAGGAMTPEPIPLNILHEDADLLVVDKPAGMLVHPTRSVKSGTLANALTYHLNRDSRTLVRPGLPHRLDRATSGLMVVAKNQRALAALSRHFHRRLVEKRYLALVHGRVGADELTISAPVGRVEEGWPKWRVTEGGRAAESRLRVVERRASRTLVELEPVTGRTNQLRIHCAHAGHPVVGDGWYGSTVEARLCLHAARLAFNHPSGGARVEFASALPAEIASLLESTG